jgi:uncharacterized RDD family membrane protein YckC
MYPDASEPQDIFLEGEFIEYTEATATQRFLNYIVDMLLMRFGLSWLTTFALVKFLLVVSPKTAYAFFGGGEWFLAGAYLIAIVNHIFYYTLCEKLFRGHTLGKLITGTRVIREDGDELTLKDALLRSLCRLVPFEAFSIWSERGLWHDVWTKTKVIQTR